tara:strand:- start:636 stop:860 length:225 start_codon:yes stop_codon:yes gene_type:complete
MKHDLAKIVREAMKNVLKEMDAESFNRQSGEAIDTIPKKVGQSTVKEMDAVSFKRKNGMGTDLVPKKVGTSTTD